MTFWKLELIAQGDMNDLDDRYANYLDLNIIYYTKYYTLFHEYYLNITVYPMNMLNYSLF